MNLRVVFTYQYHNIAESAYLTAHDPVCWGVYTPMSYSICFTESALYNSVVCREVCKLDLQMLFLEDKIKCCMSETQGTGDL